MCPVYGGWFFIETALNSQAMLLTRQLFSALIFKKLSELHRSPKPTFSFYISKAYTAYLSIFVHCPSHLSNLAPFLKGVPATCIPPT